MKLTTTPQRGVIFVRVPHILAVTAYTFDSTEELHAHAGRMLSNSERWSWNSYSRAEWKEARAEAAEESGEAEAYYRTGLALFDGGASCVVEYGCDDSLTLASDSKAPSYEEFAMEVLGDDLHGSYTVDFERFTAFYNSGKTPLAHKSAEQFRALCEAAESLGWLA